MFTLGEMECMGACVNAPMIAVADYTKVGRPCSRKERYGFRHLLPLVGPDADIVG